MSGPYGLRLMRRSELDRIVEWAAAEGWNPGLGDADAFYAADPAGFFVGTLRGDVIASISIVRYDPSYAFLGFYLVRPEYRGRGYGLQLWRHALERTSARTIGLDGVIAQIPTYERAGFTYAYRSVRYVTRTAEHAAVGSRRRAVRPAELSRLIGYDAWVFGASRPTFLAAWVSQRGAETRQVMDESGAVLGYGVIRPAAAGYRIGPIFAEAPDVAETLLKELLASAPSGVDVAIDAPGANPAATRLAQDHHMIPTFETARMYLGPAPAARSHAVYGVTSFELG